MRPAPSRARPPPPAPQPPERSQRPPNDRRSPDQGHSATLHSAALGRGGAARGDRPPIVRAATAWPARPRTAVLRTWSRAPSPSYRWSDAPRGPERVLTKASSVSDSGKDQHSISHQRGSLRKLTFFSVGTSALQVSPAPIHLAKALGTVQPKPVG